MNFENIIKEVIEEEKNLIGPVALRKAENIDGLTVSDGEVKLDGNGEKALNELLESYSDIVGSNAVEALKREVKNNLEEVPASWEN